MILLQEKDFGHRFPTAGRRKQAKIPIALMSVKLLWSTGKECMHFSVCTGSIVMIWKAKCCGKKILEHFIPRRDGGTGSSPILYNNILFIQFDNDENSFIIALDAVSGDEKWRIKRDEKTTYSTPYIWRNKMRTELVTCGKTARSYDPETGKLLWELKTGGDMVIPSPVGNEELLFLGNPGSRDTKAKLFAIKAGGNGDITATGVAWMSEESGLGNPSPLLFKDRLYVIGSREQEIPPLKGAGGCILRCNCTTCTTCTIAQPIKYYNHEKTNLH